MENQHPNEDSIEDWILDSNLHVCLFCSSRCSADFPMFFFKEIKLQRVFLLYGFVGVLLIVFLFDVFPQLFYMFVVSFPRRPKETNPDSTMKTQEKIQFWTQFFMASHFFQHLFKVVASRSALGSQIVVFLVFLFRSLLLSL